MIFFLKLKHLFTYVLQTGGEVRLPVTAGIAGRVATTGQLLNIKDAYSHPLFYRGFDDSTGFKTRLEIFSSFIYYRY